MNHFDLNEFFALLRTIEVDAENLTAIQLDQYIAAYRDGARDADSLKSAIAAPVFPMKVDIYAGIDHDYLCEVGEQLGLGGDVLRKFASAAGALRLPCTVERDGSLIVEAVDDIDLMCGVVL